MKVAAICPVFNQAKYIREAYESFVDQVEHVYIVDDGSTDGSIEALGARHDNTEVIVLPRNGGTAGAINAGFEAAMEAKPDLVTWVSSDNNESADWREHLEAAFDGNVGAVYSGYRRHVQGRPIDPFSGPYKGDARDFYSGPYDRDKLINTLNCFFGPSFMIRREVWEKAGPHRGKISHDYDHWLRVEEACWDLSMSIVSLPLILCLYRVHDERATVLRRDQFDAHHWQEEARKRRAGQ